MRNFYDLLKKLSVLLALMLTISYLGYSQTLDEGFESSTFPPSDWTLQSNASDVAPWTLSTNEAHNGSNSAKANFGGSGSYTNEWLISPRLIISSGDNIKFWRKFDGGSATYPDTMEILVSNDGMSTWNQLAIYTPDTSYDASFVLRQYDLSSYTGSNCYIAFRYASSWGYNSYIDDVSGPSLWVPSCPKPTNLSSSNITTSSADISWTTGGASDWNIEYGPAGYTQGNGTYVADVSNPYTISGLSAGTSYDVYVQDSCSSSDVSTWAGPYTFTTVVSAPYFEGFEHSGNWPSSMTRSSSTDVTITSSCTSSGSYALFIDGVDNSYATTPLISLSSNTANISFDWMNGCNNDPESSDEATVEYWDGSSWNTLSGWPKNDEHNNWSNYATSVTVSSQQIKLRFEVTSGTGSGYDDWQFDNIDVSVPEPHDMTTTAWVTPADGLLSPNEQVEIQIANVGTQDQTDPTVSYSIDGGNSWTTETMSQTVSSGDTANYTFSATADMDTAGFYNVMAAVNVAGDTVNTGNDTLTTTIESLPLYSMPFSDGFEGTLDKWSFSGSANPNTTTDEAYEGSKSLELVSGAGEDASARINFEATSGAPILSFAYMVDYYNYNEFSVEIQESDSSTWTKIHEFTGGSSDDDIWIYKELTLDTLNTTSGPFSIRMNAKNTHSFSREVWVDDFEIFVPPPHDMAVLDWIEPTDRLLSPNEQVEIQIANVGTQDQTNPTVSYSIDGGNNWTTETMSQTVSSGDTLNYTFSATADMDTTGVYNCLAAVNVPDDTVNTGNDTLTTTIESQPAFALPFNENFESFASSEWFFTPQSGYRWEIESGSTGSSNTGPDGDHTTGNGDYLAIEASSGGTGDIAYFYSPNIDTNSLPASPVIKFYYHMYGDDMGDLYVQEFANGSWTSVDSIKGEQQTAESDPWLLKSVNLSANVTRVRFKAISGGSFNGDMAIDDITMPLDNDMAITNWLMPQDGLLSTSEQVKIKLANVGLQDQTDPTVSYSIDGGNSWTTETMSQTVAAGDTVNYTFSATAHMDTAGFYNCIAAVNVSGDTVNTSNDTLTTTVESYPTFTLPFAENYESTLDAWKFSGSASPATSTSEAYEGSQSLELVSSDGDNASATINFEAASGAPRLSFAYYIESYSYNEFSVEIQESGSSTWTKIHEFTGGYSDDDMWIHKQFYLDTMGINTTSGVFKIRLNAENTSSYSTYKVYVDDFDIYVPSDNDLVASDIYLPLEAGIEMTNSTEVGLEIYNIGLVAQSGYDVYYSVDGGSFVTETVSATIDSATSHQHTFSTTADLSTYGMHEIKAVVSNSGDTVNYNDTITKFVYNHETPYTQKFDSVSTPDLPKGWSYINESNGYVKTDGYRSVSTPNSLDIFNSSSSGGEILMATMPPYYGNISDKWIRMDIYSETTDDSLIVGVLDNPQDATTFTGVDTITFTDDNVWGTFFADLTGYTGTGNYIALRHTSTDTYSDMYIDDLTLETMPSGPVLTFDADTLDMGKVRYNFSDTTIKTVTVTNNGISGMDVTNTTISGTNSSNFAVVDTNTYPKTLGTFENLSLQVEFFGSTEEAKTASLDVTTNSTTHNLPIIGKVVDASIDSFPFVETMDHMGNPPLGWKTYATSGFDWNIGQSTGSNNTGAEQDHTTGTGYFAYTEASGAGSEDSAMIITPLTDFTTLASPKMNFWYHMHGSDMGDLYIDVAVGGNWISAIDSIKGEQQPNQDDAWLMKTVDLGIYASADSIRFTAVSNGSFEGDISIDDIAFGEDPDIDLGPDTAICADASITLDAGYDPDWNYEWYVDTMDVVVDSIQTITVDSAAKYYVKVIPEGDFTTTGGFYGLDSINVDINELPVVNFPDLAEICVDGNAFSLDTVNATPAGGTFSGPGVSGDSFDPAAAGDGTHEIIYTYVDDNGCSNSDNTFITVNPLPVVNFPDLAKICVDGNAFNLDTVNATPAGGTFSGPGVSNDSFDPAAAGAGTHELIYTYVDDNGCSNTDTSYITVNPLPDITVSAATNPVNYGTATEIEASVSGSSSYTYAWSPTDSLADPSNYDQSTLYTKTLTKPTNFNVVVTDDVTGCTNDKNLNITITGGPLNVTPIAYREEVCKNDTTKLFTQASGGNETYTYSWSSNPAGFTSTDANPIATVDTTTTYTVTVDDGFSTAIDSITVIADPYAPTAMTQDVTAYLDNSGQASITTSDIDDGSYDNCAVANLALDKTSFDCSDVGTNDVVLTVTDDNNNSANTSAVVTVVDTVKPEVVTQDINAYLDSSGQTGITPNDVDDGSTDNCTIDSMSLDVSEFTCSDEGSNTVALTVVDVNGNSAQANAEVTVIDTIKPTVNTQDITAYLDNSGNVTINPADVDNNSTDNCSIMDLSLDISSFTCSNIGPNTVMLTATDGNMNSATEYAEVTVMDTVKPTVNTQDITVYLDNSGNVSITPADVDDNSTDNCTIDNMSLDVNSFSCADVGANTVNLTVTDIYGNSATASATVTVEDNIAPMISVVNIPVFLDASGQATITAADVNNNTTDNCGVDTMMLSQYNFTCSDKGPNLIDFTAEDVNGNTSTTTVVATVYDTETPTVNTNDITVYLNNMGIATIAAADVDNNSTDNCSIMSMSLNNTMFTCSDIGSNTVTLTVTDNSLNSATDNAQVTVMDTTAPQVNTNNITVYLDNNGQASITPSDINNGTSDNCNLSQMTLNKQSFDCTDIGNNTVTLTATDVNGNSASKDAIVNVVDNTAPSVNTNDITVYLDASGTASITASDLDNGSTDNCSIDTMMLDQYDFNCNDVGSHMVTLTAKDMSNNSASDIAVITVEDTISPNVMTNNMTVYLDDNGEASISLSDIENGSTDNCGIDTMQLDQTMFSGGDLGTNTIHLTVTDVNNNSATQTAMVTVEDTIAPVFTPKPDTLVCGAGVFDFSMPDAIDNCTPTVTQISGPSNTDPLAAGTYTFEFVASDNAGNTDTTAFTAIVSDPQADLGPDTTICHNSSIELTLDSGYVDYTWSTGDSTHTVVIDSSGLGIGTHNIWVTVTDSMGCTTTDTIEITIDDCTGIHEFSSQGEINIYPNPNKGMFNLEIQDIEDSKIEVCIYNFNGQKILCEQIKQNFKNGFVKSFDLSKQPKGVYLIRLTGNTTQVTERIIIQ